MPQVQNIAALLQFWFGLRTNDKLGQISLQTPMIYDAVVSATLAEINAGKTLITGIPGHHIVPVNFLAVVTTTFTTATSIDITTTDGTNVVSFPIASVTNNAKLVPESSGSTLGAGFNPASMVAATKGQSLQVGKTGSNAAGGASILFRIQYKIVAG